MNSITQLKATDILVNAQLKEFAVLYEETGDVNGEAGAGGLPSLAGGTEDNLSLGSTGAVTYAQEAKMVML